MSGQVTDDTNTSVGNPESGFLTRWKDPTATLLGIVTIVTIFGGGFIAGAAWMVEPKVEVLRGELTALQKETKSSVERAESTITELNDRIEENSDRIGRGGERIAGMEAALTAKGDRIDRLHVQVTKNSEEIVELKVRGTPDPPD